MTIIIKREGPESIGRPLTNIEVDTNFNSLNVDKLQRDGEIAMTGNLKTPGIRPTNGQAGLVVLNGSGQTAATFAQNNSQDLTVNGNFTAGNITGRNLTLTGRIISDQLNGQYNVSNIGETYRGVVSFDASDNKLIITVDTILNLVSRLGNFAVNQQISGAISGTVGLITKVSGDSVWVRLQTTSTFVSGEIVVQVGSNEAINGIVSRVINTSLLNLDHKIKVFGVSTVGADVAALTPVSTASRNGVISGSPSNYHYWISQFRFSDGRVAPALKIQGSVSHSALSLFNLENNIALSLTRTNAAHGLVVYRGTSDSVDAARLVAVLGPNDLGSSTSGITYVDYGTFANTEWSTKDSLTNTFTTESGVIHFPLSPNTTALEGWRTMTVQSVTSTSTFKCTESAIVTAGAVVEFVHDNTAGLQQAINDNRDLALRNIVLPNGTYYTSRLDVPNDFSVIGSGKLTTVKQIPWNFEYINDNVYPSNKGNIFMSKSSQPQNIYFSDLTIDGNFVNNVQYQEVQSNYAVALPNSQSVDVSKLSITNVVGGGLYLYGSNQIRIQDSDITNGSLTYRGENLSPIYAGESTNLTITGNLCENFVSPVDVSVSIVGVVVGNTIRNCGSGLLVYGSGSLLSSPNLLMGPDSEYLPSPDTQDSDYNSINIQIPRGGVDYISPAHLYMQRGDVIWLGSTDDDSSGTVIQGSAVTLSSNIFVLTKYRNSEMVKTAWDYSLNNGQPIIHIFTENRGDFGRNNGYFQYSVSRVAAAALPNLVDLYNEHGPDLLPGTPAIPGIAAEAIPAIPAIAGEEIVGLVYQITATAYTYTILDERLLIESGIFSTDGSDSFYTVTLKAPGNFSRFAIGDEVKIFDHTTTPEVNTAECTVIDIIGGVNPSTPKQLKLRLPFTLSGTPQGGTESGYITIKKTVIIAKGRIL